MSACPSCAALWLDPRPTEETIGEAYQTYYTHGEAGLLSRALNSAILKVAQERAVRVYGFARADSRSPPFGIIAEALYPGLTDHADSLIRHLPASAMGATGRILDVGCGDGNGVAFLQSIGWRASGVEVDPLAVSAARERGLDVIQGDIRSGGFADETFDAVTSSHVIEHVHDPKTFLAESRRVLKTGGVLVTSTPNAQSESRQTHGRNWRGLEPPRHLLLFSAENLADLARSVGFRNVRVKRTAHLASYMHIASRELEAGGRPRGLLSRARLWAESKIIETRLDRDLKRGRGEGSELTLIAEK